MSKNDIVFGMSKTPSCFSATVDLKLASKLKEDLTEQGFTFTKPPYTIFAAKNVEKAISCSLYESGKITVQGKGMGPFLEFYLEPEILQTFSFSHPQVGLDLTPRIGLDESGKGDFFGPLCIAGLYADADGIKQLVDWGIKDSKKLNDVQIVKMAKKIRAAYSYTVIRFYPTKYNELYDKFKNLNRLMAWTHTAALSELAEKTGCKEAILDQFADKSLVDNQMKQKKLDVHLLQKVRGEEDVVVAGASILARAAFVEGMEKLGEEFGLIIPKGASGAVKEAARKLIAKFGPDVLPKVAKIHFKTAKEVLS
jgi:ribonuclease HIII